MAVWNNRTIYNTGDQVTYLSLLYSSTQNFNLNRVPSPYNNEWWVLVNAAGVQSVAAGTNIALTGTATNPIVNAAAVSPSPAGSYAFPTNVTFDAYGRATAATGGVQPVTSVATSAPLTRNLVGGALSMAMDIDNTDLSTTAGPTPGMLSLTTVPAVAGTYAYPTSIAVNSKGRTTAVVGGPQPVGSVSAGTGITVTGTTAPTVSLTTLSPSPAGTYDALAGLTVNAQGQVTSAVAGSVGTAIGDYLFWDTATSRWTTGSTRIKLGSNAGALTQGNNAVAIGTSAGNSTQAANAVAIGNSAGTANQGAGAIAIGASAGNTNAGSNSIAIGSSAGGVNLGQSSIAIGTSATSAGTGSVAIGISAGTAANDSVSVGGRAGQITQGTQAVAVGAYAGAAGQSTQAVSVGAYSSSLTQTGQGAGAVSIGYNAAQSGQGASAIAIGRNAVAASQGANSIVLNATNTAVLATAAGQTIITPMRTTAAAGYASNVLAYRSNGEVITTTNRFDTTGNLQMAGNNVVGATDVGTATTTFQGPGLTPFILSTSTLAGHLGKVAFDGANVMTTGGGGSSGQHLAVVVNGTPYVIDLKNP